MTLGQFINEVYNNVKDPYNKDQRIGQVLMNTLSARNPKLHALILNDSNYDCFYNNELVASTMSFICQYPEYWDN